MKDPHKQLRLYWYRSGRPPLVFKLGDDPWVPVQGQPTFNPAFRYAFADSLDALAYEASQGTATVKDTDIRDSYEYKRGYKQAIDDIKAEAERLAMNRMCRLKSSM